MPKQNKDCATREQVFKYIEKQYGTKPEFLWFNLPGYAVFRQEDTKKWFAIVMNVPKNRLGFDGEEEIDILDVKCDPFMIDFLLNEQGFLPAYHLHKGSWITILLDGSCPFERVCEMLEQSYKMASRKAHKQKYRDYNLDWIVPVNLKYFDIEKAFNESGEILWKQSSSIIAGDVVYIYLASPYSAIMYKCKVTEVNIPYAYTDDNVRMDRVMKVKLSERYKKDEIPLSMLKEHGIVSIRGPRKMLNSLRYRIENLHTKTK